MGQAYSRNRSVRSSPQLLPSIDPPPYEAIRRDVPRTVDAQSSDVLASDTPAQRPSIRRSLRTLLSPKSLKSLRHRGDRSASQSASRSSRKRWPTSRRWSTVPEEFIAPSQDVVAEGSSEGSDTPSSSSNTNHAEREDVNADTGRRSSRKSWPTSRRWSTAPEELAARQQHIVASIPEDAPVASSSTNGVEKETAGVDTGRRSSRKSWPTSRRWSTAPEELAAQSQEMVTSIPEDAPVTSSSTHRVESESVRVDTGRRSSRKSWPTSRRWSTAPEELVTQQQETVTSFSEDTAEGLDAPLSANRGEREHIGETITPVYHFTTASPVYGPSIPAAESVTSNLSVGENEPETSSNIGSWMGGQGSLVHQLGLPNSEEDEVVISPSTFTEERDHHTGVEASAEITDRTQTSTQPVQDGQAPIPAPLPLPLPPPSSEPQPHRPFPPPGTLVVVQGVVHTTDVSPPQPPPPAPAATLFPPSPTPMTSRRASSFIPQPSRGEASFPRSRRGSVLPRTTGMRTRPSSMFESTSVIEGNSDSEPGTPSDGETTNGSGSDTRTSIPSEPATPVLSPSSIDVLGTLLSVAAAATAASLLTGSSDPIFTPSLNPSSAPNGTSLQSNSIFDRPTSPTPTAGLGNLGSLSAALGLGTPEAAPQTYGGRERMRHVWGTLRDRLGRRMAGHGSNSQAASVNEQRPNINGRTRPSGAPIDTREIMLAEMARAFNLGLGLSNRAASPDAGAGGERNNGQAESGPSPSATSPGSDGVPRPPELQLPAEGSFERFLMDLQVDLRAALSAQDSPVNQLPYTQHSDPEVRLADSRSASPIPSSSSRPTIIVEHDAQPQAEEVNVGSLSPLPLSTTPASLTDQDDEQDLLPLPPSSSVHQEDGIEDDPELPGTGPLAPLSASSRSDSESDNANGNLPEMSEVPRVPPDSSPSEEGVTMEPGSASRTERRPGGGINWWRSYRFPPITAPHVHGLPTMPNGMNSATSPPATPHSSDHSSEASITPSSSTPLVSPSSSTQDRGSSASSPVDNRPNVVVPVIVVGLQSVNMDRRREQAPPFGDGTFGANHNEPEPSVLADDLNFGGMLDDADPGAFPGSPRARPWHSRAASAFRNLRPGRRTTHATHTNGGPGSRTFLIYVIGGYYPPDHGLITGANALDSFEALWELAELLGQVKPQTVSKEEIDNSGLEVIQPAALEQYEKDGKIASNCMERCLICLDDYVPETDLRLLKCKHAFHKSCVDQWLQTGKNNCPACRTKGVSTPESTPT
ncbi:hypothetical protein PILCRDRAFT_824363 [Piloderma croceum F 1598]|uniref:RING-type domain-containing protein n=1 Tax=Piloderma croceum (strain F 1598) TaxID=765440 RepID=A0A0C3BMC9_PILCF|nr:hypothetical protein PILCRDRAFT_824363 [Piloderma croceum F 1598]